MQLIAEAYALLKNSLQLDPETMHRVFAEWNRGELNSFLIEITARIVHFKDPKGGYLIDRILDVAGQKGTGKWSVVTAVDENDPLTLITEAVYARLISSMKEARITASGLYPGRAYRPQRDDRAANRTTRKPSRRRRYTTRCMPPN